LVGVVVFWGGPGTETAHCVRATIFGRLTESRATGIGRPSPNAPVLSDSAGPSVPSLCAINTPSRLVTRGGRLVQSWRKPGWRPNRSSKRKVDNQSSGERGPDLAPRRSSKARPTGPAEPPLPGHVFGCAVSAWHCHETACFNPHRGRACPRWVGHKPQTRRHVCRRAAAPKRNRPYFCRRGVKS